MKALKTLLLITLTFILFLNTGCKKEKENINGEIKDFVWKGLNANYLWVDNVPNLSSSKFYDQPALDVFLSTYNDPEELFYDLLYNRGTIDRFSWISKDYTELENYFEGITKSMGFEFDLFLISENSENILGVVLYVIKGSPADRAGLKRGDFFIKINDTQLTVNNYQSLLYNTNSYKLGFASVSGGIVSPSSRYLNLVAEEVHENPIYMDTVYNINSKKIGYLVYNGFMSDYDVQLNTVIAKFKASGINKLIVDLRYNGGGALTSAQYMASMIYGTNTSEVFLTTRYNSKVQSYISNLYGAAFFKTFFTDKIVIDETKPNLNVNINTLNMSEVYFLTSGKTASASEAVINGLKPYLNVVSIGDTTYGKYVGSWTIKDYIDENTVNPKHKWAMQPIVVKIANKNGVSDYDKGLIPNLTLKENVSNLKQFGDTSEIMLKTAINYINGITNLAPVPKSKAIIGKPFTNSKQERPHAMEMTMGEMPKELRIIR